MIGREFRFGIYTNSNLKFHTLTEILQMGIGNVPMVLADKTI